MRCLEKDPAQRYQSVAELDDALAQDRRRLSPAPATIEPTPLSQWSSGRQSGDEAAAGRPLRSARRPAAEIVLAAAAVAAVAVLAAVAYLTLWRTRRRDPVHGVQARQRSAGPGLGGSFRADGVGGRDLRRRFA